MARWTLPEHHRLTADRIPAKVRAQLQDHELLARCEYATTLERQGKGCSDGATARGFYQLASTVLRANAPAQLEADLRVLRDGLASAPHHVAPAYSTAISELERKHPQPPDEYLNRARGAVAVDGAGPPPGKPIHMTREAAKGDGRVYQTAPGRWRRADPGEEPMLYKSGGRS